MACKAFDGQVVRHDSQIEELLEKFVRVRIVQGNAMNLSLFQFDYDLTFAAFFLNADQTIYGRYGTRSSAKDADKDISLEGFGKAMQAALELHQQFPAHRDSLAAKRGPRPRYPVPETYPSLSAKYTPTLDYAGRVAQSCIHCHQVAEAERKVLRASQKPIPDGLLFPWPTPEVIGLTLDPRETARVSSVARGSAAERDGFRAGDQILKLEGQPIISIADVQWVLYRAREPVKLKAEIRRNGERLELPLTLAAGWRRQSDISWRPTTWDLRRMAFGGLVLEDLSAEERRRAGLSESALALRIKHVGQYNEHAAAKRAGFQKEDVIVSVDGQSRRLTESQLITYLLQNKSLGARVPVTVLRGGRRVELNLPQQ